MRHRNIKLTLEVYTDEALLPSTAAMATLPSLVWSPAQLGFEARSGDQKVTTSGHILVRSSRRLLPPGRSNVATGQVLARPGTSPEHTKKLGI